MLEKEKIRFFDTERLTETKDFSAHCKTSYLQSALKDRFPDMKFQVTSASINQTGMYVSKEAAWIKLIGGDNRIRNLPPYVRSPLMSAQAGIPRRSLSGPLLPGMTGLPELQEVVHAQAEGDRSIHQIIHREAGPWAMH